MRMLNDSNTNWLGNIPAEWSIGRIGQLYSERRVKVSDTEYMPLSVTMKGVVPQLSTAAKTDAHDDRKLVRKGDFAINSRSDRRGSCGISEYDGSVSLINTILAPRKSMSPRYYNWLFHTSEFAAEFYKWGHGIVDDLWTTNWNDMKRILVPVPSLLEQERIADFLDRKCADIDNILEKTRASIEEYKKLKQSVITEVVTKGVRGTRPMKDSGIEWIGEIPEEWRISKIQSIASTTSGSTPRNIVAEESSSIIWVRTTDINESIVYDSSVHLTKEEFESASCPLLPPGTCVVAMYGGKGTIGKSGMLGVECTINQALCSMVIKDSHRYNNHYLFFVLRFLRPYWMLFAEGTRKDPNINQDIVRRMMVPIPNIVEQCEISTFLNKKCSELDSLIASKEKFITELESYKKSLIYEYVTGKKEVPSNA